MGSPVRKRHPARPLSRRRKVLTLTPRMPGEALLALALAIGPRPAPGVAELSRTAFQRSPDLVLHLHAGLPFEDALAAPAEARRGRSRPPPCLGEICQPRVAVPGFEPRYGRAHRSELFVLALTRAHVEPIATIAWALAATGLRFDWTPVAFDGPNAGGHGWGSVFLRLRLRLDAENVPVFVPRPR